MACERAVDDRDPNTAAGQAIGNAEEGAYPRSDHCSVIDDCLIIEPCAHGLDNLMVFVAECGPVTGQSNAA